MDKRVSLALSYSNSPNLHVARPKPLSYHAKQGGSDWSEQEPEGHCRLLVAQIAAQIAGKETTPNSIDALLLGSGFPTEHSSKAVSGWGARGI